VSEPVLDTARRALAAAGEGEALATVTRERSLMLRFAHNRPTQSTAVDDATIEVTVLCDGHLGRASANASDPDALRACARAARTAAEAAARGGHGGYPGFPAPSPIRAHDGHDVATAQLDPAVGGAALAAVFEVADRAGALASGIWTAGEVQTAIASSTGVEVADRVTDAFIKVIAFGPGGRSGYASQTSFAAGQLDPAGTAEVALGKALMGGEGVALEPGDYPVMLERSAVREVLWALARTAFDGLAHAEGRGALTGRLGTRVVSPAVNLSDSPRYGSTLPRAFDAEGVPKSPIPLIQDGVAHRVVHHTRSGALAGQASTGHALSAGDAGPPAPTNLVMVGGGAEDERDLCAPIERGIYVTRLWYTNIVRPRESLFTAVTRDGTFLIEDGQVTRPAADMRVTDLALGILSRIQALGARSLLTGDGELYGRRFAYGMVCPPLRASAVTFSGSAERS
jgi:predicted Zn-dependent protease